MSQNALPDPIHFQQGKPFYDMVSAYITAVTGLESVFDRNNRMGFKPGEVATLEGLTHPEIKIEPFRVYQMAMEGKIDIPHVVHSLANMLMNTAYEAVKDTNDNSPEFEFFRHVRNASSHRNMFNFFAKEPSRLAFWRGKSLDHTRQGASNPLFGQQCFGAFLASADAIVLLWDIEQKLK